MKPVRLFQPVFGVLAACAALAQQSAEPVPPSVPDEEDVPEFEEEWDFSTGRGPDALMLERLNLLVPRGRSHEGLRYPVYGEGAGEAGPALESVFESRRVTRMDETHLQLEGVVYSSFGDAKTPDKPTRMVTMKDAIYDLQHEILFTDAPVKIDDKEMSIHSGAMIHDRASGLTLFSGGVQLFIHEQPKKKPEPKAEAPGAPPAESSPTPENPPTPSKTP